MKKKFYTGILTIITIMMIAGFGFAQQMSHGQGTQTGQMPQGMMSQQQGGMMSQQQGGWFCPWCGRMCGMHRGMMHGKMMHHKGMMMQGGAQAGQPLNQEQAKMMVKHYLKMKGNPNLKLGKLTDQKDYFVAEITTKDGSLVEKYQIDKNTGWFKSIY
ncbi:MAG TPA: hypothetical protein ENG51_22760 [Deltaproteobacteria bacterium]|nr:hypothetical protein [Deltaproteobacteria bacterium]